MRNKRKIQKQDSSLTIEIEWMKTKQVATYLSTTPTNIRNMVYKGYLIPRKVGGRLYFKKTEVDYLIETEGGHHGYKTV